MTCRSLWKHLEVLTGTLIQCRVQCYSISHNNPNEQGTCAPATCNWFPHLVGRDHPKCLKRYTLVILFAFLQDSDFYYACTIQYSKNESLGRNLSIDLAVEALKDKSWRTSRANILEPLQQTHLWLALKGTGWWWWGLDVRNHILDLSIYAQGMSMERFNQLDRWCIWVTTISGLKWWQAWPEGRGTEIFVREYRPLHGSSWKNCNGLLISVMKDQISYSKIAFRCETFWSKDVRWRGSRTSAMCKKVVHSEQGCKTCTAEVFCQFFPVWMRANIQTFLTRATGWHAVTVSDPSGPSASDYLLFSPDSILVTGSDLGYEGTITYHHTLQHHATSKFPRSRLLCRPNKVLRTRPVQSAFTNPQHPCCKHRSLRNIRE